MRHCSRIRRHLILPLVAFIFVLLARTSEAAQARVQILLDTVIGQTAPGELSYPKATFIFKVITDPTSCDINIFTSGFRVYSPDGATFELNDTISIDTLPHFMDAFETTRAIGVFYGSAEVDTVKFSGLSIMPPHIPPGYQSQAFAITVFPRQEDVGKTICIDSSFYRPAGKFLWVCDLGVDTNARPTWVGPYCYTITHPAYVPEPPPPSPASCQVALANDLDKDNFTDIVYTSAASPFGLYVAWGKSDYTFDTSTVSSALTHGGRIELGFLDGDDLLDIIVADGTGLYGFVQGPGVDGKGNREFTQSSISLPTGSNTSLTTLFWNNDSFLDAITSGGAIGGSAFYREGGANIYYGTGVGSFSPGPTLPFAVKAVGAGDFNNDGLDDFAAVHGPLNTDSVQIVLGTGNGGYSLSTSVAVYSNVTEDDRDLKVGDFDGDGKDDFAFLTHPQAGGTSLCYAFGDGLGEFIAPDCRSLDGVATNLAVGDFNGDNRQDVATVQGTVSQTLVIYYGDDARTFADTQTIDLPVGTTAASALASGDFNHDGNLDFLIGSSDPAGDPLLQLNSTLPPQPVLPFEMVVTSYSSSRPPDVPPGTNPPTGNISPVDVKIVDPAGRLIARAGSTVAGAVAWAGDLDGNTQIDNRLINYNVLEGTHKVIVTPRDGAPPGSSFSMSIRLNGSAQVTPYFNYTIGSTVGTMSTQAAAPIVFQYDVGNIPAVQPANGLPTNSQQPTFDWSAKVGSLPGTARHKFQLSAFHDFHLLYSEVSDLPAATYRPGSPLPRDTVLFWRYAVAPDGINYQPFDPDSYYAVYVTGCCSPVDKLRGDISNGNGTTPDGDGVTDGSDLQTSVEYVFFNDATTLINCPDMQDVNNDATFDGADLGILVDYIFFNDTSVIKRCNGSPY